MFGGQRFEKGEDSCAPVTTSMSVKFLRKTNVEATNSCEKMRFYLGRLYGIIIYFCEQVNYVM